MDNNKICGGRALGIAVGITTLVLMMAGGALSDKNISSQNDINNSFIIHRMDSGIPSNQGLGGRIQENEKLLPVRSIEKAAVLISANTGWFINDNATGGDCIFIGSWNAVSKTCTLTTDLNKTIEIDSDSLTLDGNGHTLTGSSSEYGIILSGRSGVTIKNTNVRSFYNGIYLYYSNNNMLSGNNASNNYYGLFLQSSGINTLSDNNVSNNTYGIYLYSSNINTLSGNNASNNSYGIYLYFSNNNTLSDNNASNNYNGIDLWDSNYNMLNGNNALNNELGINLLDSCNNNTLSGNKALSNDDGINLWDSSNNTLSGNKASNNNVGVYLDGSSNNMLSDNNASNNDDGINLWDSSNNTLSGNKASNNNLGVYLDGSSNNMLFNNIMMENSFNFGLNEWSDSDFSNQIDYSNTVDGKPIYYVKNGNNTIYDSSTNAGIFFCISCLNVTIKDIELLKNGVGIFFWNTTSSKIQNVTVSNNYEGIVLRGSSNNTLSSNNAISNSYCGIDLWDSGNNNIYNNLFNNTNNLHIDRSVNIWNINKMPGTNIIGGSYLGGNLWANPSGTGFSQTCADADSDGTCDSPYVLDSNNFDYLPLTYIITQTLLDSYLPPGASPEMWKAGVIRAMDDYFAEPSLLTKSQLLSIMDAYFS